MMREYQSIVEAIMDHGEMTPDKVAFYFEEYVYTYARLAGEIRKAAGWLKANGITQGQRVLVEAVYSPAYVVLCYGIHLSGAVFVPIECGTPAQRVEELKTILETDKAILQEPGNTGALSLNDTFEQIIHFDGPDNGYRLPDPGAMVEILFTTGTTGKSKGVMVSHRNQVTMALAGIEGCKLEEDNVWLIATPMNHAGGLRKMHMSMFRGSTTCLVDGMRNLKEYFRVAHDRGVTSLFLPPAAVHIMLTFARKEMAGLKDQLRFIYSSSAVYPQHDKDEMKKLLPGVCMYNVYGASECGLVAIVDFNHGQDIPGSVGKALSYSKITVLDEQYREIGHSSAEHYGLLGVRSASVMMGYWREPELTASVIRDGMLVLSDNGYYDEEGRIILIGRSNDVINIGGYKVAPNEVEEIVRSLDEIDDCLLIPAGKGNVPILKLLVVMKPGCEPDEKAIVRYLSEKLEAYKLPKKIVKIDAIEKTFNGKTDRKKMIAMYQ